MMLLRTIEAMACRSDCDRHPSPRGAPHLMLGSVAEGLIRVATKSILLIRGRKKGCLNSLPREPQLNFALSPLE